MKPCFESQYLIQSLPNRMYRMDSQRYRNTLADQKNIPSVILNPKRANSSTRMSLRNAEESGDFPLLHWAIFGSASHLLLRQDFYLSLFDLYGYIQIQSYQEFPPHFRNGSQSIRYHHWWWPIRASRCQGHEKAPQGHRDRKMRTRT